MSDKGWMMEKWGDEWQHNHVMYQWLFWDQYGVIPCNLSLSEGLWWGSEREMCLNAWVNYTVSKTMALAFFCIKKTLIIMVGNSWYQFFMVILDLKYISNQYLDDFGNSAMIVLY